LLAALEIATGKVIAHVRDRRTTVIFSVSWTTVVKAYPVNELCVVLDNLNIHRTSSQTMAPETIRACISTTPRHTLPG